MQRGCQRNVGSHGTVGSSSDTKSESSSLYGEQVWYGVGEEVATDDDEPQHRTKKHISVGDFIPYGLRLYVGFNNIIRFRDIGVKNRILIVGVIGSFTPLCWNRHFFQVLTKLRYYEERGIAYICCVSTNDSFVQAAWGSFLGCFDKVVMIGDPTGKFTKALGMDIVVPWMDASVRSMRYIIYAEDMVVTKILVAPSDELPKEWCCDHLFFNTSESEDDEDEEDSVAHTWT